MTNGNIPHPPTRAASRSIRFQAKCSRRSRYFSDRDDAVAFLGPAAEKRLARISINPQLKTCSPQPPSNRTLSRSGWSSSPFESSLLMPLLMMMMLLLLLPRVYPDLAEPSDARLDNGVSYDNVYGGKVGGHVPCAVSLRWLARKQPSSLEELARPTPLQKDPLLHVLRRFAIISPWQPLLVVPAQDSVALRAFIFLSFRKPARVSRHVRPGGKW